MLKKLLMVLMLAIGAFSYSSASESNGENKGIPFHYEIIQSDIEPYWLRIIEHSDHETIEELVIEEEYEIILDNAPNNSKRAIVTSIGDNAFVSSQLKKIVLPSTIEEIGENAFFGNILQEIEFNEGLLYIGSKAFRKSVFLKRISIPESIIYLDSQIFSQSYEIEEIVLPSTLKSLHGYTFVNCKKLKDLYCKAIIPPTADKTDFYAYWDGIKMYSESEITRNINLKECILHVPAGSEDAYRNAPGWKSFANIVPISETK